MIVLDTNVISELMRGPQADSNVRRWFADRVPKPRVGRRFIEQALQGSDG